MGPWYAELGRGDGASVVDDTPWVARGHSRETTFQRDLTSGPVDDAVRELTARVLEDVVAEGRPVVGLTLKVRYAPFLTKTHARKMPETVDRNEILAGLDLAAGIEAGRPSGSWACGPRWQCPTMPDRDIRRRAAVGDGVWPPDQEPG